MIHTCVIWDLDNCLSDDEHRIKLIDWSQYPRDACWDDYHAACAMDPPGNSQEFFRWHSPADLAKGLGCIPVFFTARPEKHRDVTRKWLAMHFGCTGNEPLFMRATGDARRSVQIKGEMLKKFRASWPKAAILAAFDDQRDIVNMYRDNKIDGKLLMVHAVESHKPPHQFSVQQVREGDVTIAFGEPVDDLGPVQGARPGVVAATLPDKQDAASVLRGMADLFETRNGQYRDNYKMVAPIIRALFPHGVPPDLVVDDRWHLFELAIVKLTRFAISQLDHRDSAQDAAVYLAMIDAINHERQKPK